MQVKAIGEEKIGEGATVSAYPKYIFSVSMNIDEPIFCAKVFLCTVYVHTCICMYVLQNTPQQISQLSYKIDTVQKSMQGYKRYKYLAIDYTQHT